MYRTIIFVCSVLVLQVEPVVAFQSSSETESPKFHDLIEPRTNVVIRQEGGKVAFEFINAIDFGLTTKKNTPNDSVTRVTVVNNFREVLWRIEAPYGGPGVSQVTYGVVPKGFTQTVPKGIKAPALKINEEYGVWADWVRGSGSFIYHGK